MAVRKIAEEIIYGPVSSRRLNKSLGINLLPPGKKLCNFNCVYCQYGLTDKYYVEGERYDFPQLPEVESELAHYIAGIGEPRSYIDSITFSGNGEPTLHPDFPEVISTTSTIRDEMIPRVSLSVLTNGSTLIDEKINNSMLLLDNAIVKLDCGCEETFKRLNRPAKGIEFADIIDGIKGIKGVVIQSLFITSDEVDNSTDDEVEKWLDVLKGFDVREAQIYTLDRPPAEKWVSEVSKERLEEIAREATNVLKRPVNVY